MKPHQFLLTTMTASALFISQNIHAADTATNDALSTGQVKQVKEVVHDYLVTNPQVLVEASQSLQKQESEKAGERAKAAIVQHADSLFANPVSPIAGNPKGTITLIEFFDYQCPHCKEMKGVIDKLIAGDSNLRVVYKELPIFGQTSKDASSAALAAIKQGPDKYLKLHNALLLAENPMSKEKLMQVAKSVGLDTTKLEKDMAAPEIQKQLDENFQLAQAVNLMGTPTFIVSKWQVGAKNNDVKMAAFIAGTPSPDALKTAIENAKKT